MGINYNPAVVQDGLVFYYDMGNTQKSWKGEPTTNFYTNGHFSGGNHVVQAQGGALSNPVNEIVLFENPGDSPYCLRTTAVGGSPFTEYEMLATGLQPNTTYTMSCWYAWSPDWNGTSEIFHSRWYTSTATEAGTTGGSGTLVETRTINGMRWNRAFHSFTTGADVNGQHSFYAGYPAQNTTGFRYFTNFMLHQGSYIVPFVNGTRSNTQAILDLTNNYTVTANSATYNSNNTFSFNGTTNKLTINNGINYSNGFTINSWIYPLSAGENSRGTIVAKNNDINNVNGFNLRFADGPRLLFSIHLSGAIFTDVSSIPYNAWTNVCITVSPSGSVIAAFYLNGNQTNTDSSSYALANITTSNLLSIGAIGSTATTDYVFDGTISVVQIYQRPLSALEVEQNFSALRGRYGV